MKRALLLAAAAMVAVGAFVGVFAVTRHTSSTNRIGEVAPSGPYRGSEPPAGIRIPDVTLPDYRGRLVGLRGLNGKITVLTFLDSKCTDSCPVIASLIGQTWPKLTAAEKQQVAAHAISVNPHTDTPGSVRKFLAARRATGVLDWLVAPVKRMRPVWHAFGVLPSLDAGSDDIHSADVRVFDRRGIWVSTLHAGVDLTPANLAHDIRLAMKRTS